MEESGRVVSNGSERSQRPSPFKFSLLAFQVFPPNDEGCVNAWREKRADVASPSFSRAMVSWWAKETLSFRSGDFFLVSECSPQTRRSALTSIPSRVKDDDDEEVAVVVVAVVDRVRSYQPNGFLSTRLSSQRIPRNTNPLTPSD